LSTSILAVIGVLYWTFAVVVLLLVLNKEDSPTKMEIATALLWPVLIPVGLVIIPYRMVFKSIEAIKADLKNKKLLKEFNEFLKEKKKDA